MLPGLLLWSCGVLRLRCAWSENSLLLVAALHVSLLQGVLYGLTRKGRVLIADEMGVGKTVQALALAACYQVQPCSPSPTAPASHPSCQL